MSTMCQKMLSASDSGEMCPPGISGFELYFSINHKASDTLWAMYILDTSPRSLRARSLVDLFREYTYTISSERIERVLIKETKVIWYSGVQ